MLLDVEKPVLGAAPGELVVERTGGALDGLTYYIDDDGGAYAPGERVLLFLEAQGESSKYYLAHPMGRFRIEGGRLAAVAPSEPVAQILDRRPLEQALELVRRAAGK